MERSAIRDRHSPDRLGRPIPHFAALHAGYRLQKRKCPRQARASRYSTYDSCVGASVQCTLTVSSSWLHALATAASRVSVSMIGVPSAAWRAHSFPPGSIGGAGGNRAATSSERIDLMYAISPSPRWASASGEIVDVFISVFISLMASSLFSQHAL